MDSRDDFVNEMNYLFDIVEFFNIMNKNKLITESLFLNNYYDYRMSLFFTNNIFTGGILIYG